MIIMLLITAGNSALAENNKLKTDSLILNQNAKEEKTYVVVEQMPQFPGGDGAMLSIIAKNIRYPESAIRNSIQGRVIVRFVVGETGKVSKAEVIKSLDPVCDKEAIRVVQLLPNFIPGKQNGKNVAVWYTLPVTFKFEDKVTVYKQKEVWSPTDKTIVVFNGKVQPANFNTDNLDMNSISSVAMIEPTNEFYKEKLRLQYGKNAENGAIIICSRNTLLKNDSSSDFIKIDDANYIFVKTDSMAFYKNSGQTANDFISENLKYPQTAVNQGIEGEVVIQFVVDKSGKIRDPRYIKKVDPLLDDAAMDVITSFPNWIPGVKNGKKINSLCTAPFTFSKAQKKLHDSKNLDDEKVYQVIEQMPQFPGGDKELLEFISKNIKYPVEAQQNKIQGRVIVRFVVSKTGEVDRVEIVRSLEPSCDKEAIRVINLLPKFIPGKQNGQNVAVWYTLPITFKLEGSAKSNVYKEHATSEIIDSTKPLYLIDGKPVTETEANNLDPQKIQKLEVLKDSSATAIYGSRAVKGVVKITTKK